MEDENLEGRTANLSNMGSMIRRKPSDGEFDVLHLLMTFMLAVHRGEPASLETFKTVWKDMYFSHIFYVSGVTFEKKDRYIRTIINVKVVTMLRL